MALHNLAIDGDNGAHTQANEVAPLDVFKRGEHVVSVFDLPNFFAAVDDTRFEREVRTCFDVVGHAVGELKQKHDCCGTF